MNAELKAKWIAALRSGEYKQTQGRLKRGDAYCCLGVLCAIAGLKTETIGEYEYFVEGDGDETVRDTWTLPRSLKVEVPEDPEDLLVVMNDDEERDFPEIADWIEANL